MKSKISISIVTVAMNRGDHIARSSKHISKISLHDEHVILDYASNPPIDRQKLPKDSRVKLFRVDSHSNEWWLTQAYNMAFALADGDYIIKVDADAIITEDFVSNLVTKIDETGADLFCSRLTRQEWSLPDGLFITNGLFACKKKSLALIGGFNPYIQGWGWDELDLFSRFFLSGLTVTKIPECGVSTIDHGDELRGLSNNKLTNFLSKETNKKGSPDLSPLKKAISEKNRQIAVQCISKDVDWPSFEDYLQSYRLSNKCPDLKSVCLFDHSELADLSAALVRRLISPSTAGEVYYRLLKVLSLGPYALGNSGKLIKKYGLDLSLVTS